jgi:hypothetical protein
LAISNLLASLPNGFKFSLNVRAPVNSESLNKQTDVSTLSLQDIDSMYSFLLFFFLGMPFQTRKFIDFQYWALVLHLTKYGYCYTSKGRALIFAIGKYINNGRYSTNPGGPITPPSTDLINEVLSSSPLVELTQGMTHIQLARARVTAKGKSSYTVYVFDNGVLVEGSPFNSYADAQEAIGVPRTSRAISRNLDSGKLYRGRYTFWSNEG